MAAEDRKLAVKDSTLTAHIEASWAARIWEGHCRRDITTAHWVKTDRAADGSAETSTICLSGDTLIEVVDLNVIVDLAARRKAEAELERRREVDLNTVLKDVDIRVVINIISTAEETRARVHDTLDAKASLETVRKSSTIDNTDTIGILSVKSGTTSTTTH